MKIENVKLMHTEQNVPIIYNKNESNYENVFILDEHNKNINGITYSCPIYFDTKFIDTSNKKKNVH